MDVDGWIGYLCGRMGRPCSLHAHARVCACACACACACTPQGEWSDESPLWDAHPDVQRALWPARSATPRARMNDGAPTRMLHMAGYVRSQAGYTRLQHRLPMVAGAFWLPFATFVKIFSDVDVCDRSTGGRGLW